MQINHDRSRISVWWSKWFIKEARPADHFFSSIGFQRLTKIARHFKLRKQTLKTTAAAHGQPEALN